MASFVWNKEHDKLYLIIRRSQLSVTELGIIDIVKQSWFINLYIDFTPHSCALCTTAADIKLNPRSLVNSCTAQ